MRKRAKKSDWKNGEGGKERHRIDVTNDEEERMYGKM